MIKHFLEKRRNNNLAENTKKYKKKDIFFPMQTNHPQPYSRLPRYERIGEWYVRNNNDHLL